MDQRASVPAAAPAAAVGRPDHDSAAPSRGTKRSGPAGDAAEEGDADAKRACQRAEADGPEADAQQQQQQQPQQQQAALPASAAQRCHSDALHCIFAFLDLRGHSAAMRCCCRDWLAAATKEPPRDLGLTISFDSALDGLLASASPLRRHVAELDAQLGLLRMDQLRQLRALPRLTDLACWLWGDDLASALAAAGESREQWAELMRDALPPRLRHLSVLLSRNEEDIPVLQALLDALPAALPQLEQLGVAEEDVGGDDWSPLLRLPLLRYLQTDGDLTDEQRAVVKQLPLLSLNGKDTSPCSDAESLMDLLTPPHRLQQLEQIDLRDCVLTPPFMTALLQLPALIVLEPFSVQPECWAQLGTFTQLQTLQLDWHSSFSAEQVAALGESLSALPHLSDLRMRMSAQPEREPPTPMRLPALRLLRLYHAHIPAHAFVQHSPLLQSLVLSAVPLRSLDFLRHNPLLEELQLLACPGMGDAADAADRAMEALRAHPPLRLHTLRIHHCGIGLSREQRAVLQPPSALLPSLRTFDYSEAPAPRACNVM